MNRKVLAIPLDEVRAQFEKNSRQDVKIVAPEATSEQLFAFLRAKGKDVKREHTFEGVWRHSEPDEPNLACRSSCFGDALSAEAEQGPFAVSFANEHAQQDEHYHKRHLEIYFSEHPISATFRELDKLQSGLISLHRGGAIIFGPRVTHKIQLNGLTIIIEIPSVSDDKFSENV